ncbi:sigma factor PP2C-like phosphatase [Subdoligranulum sp. CAG:314]|nr:sigma factor PP2C-like phosphatase [Subdoligranulum sp. CAG:314]
MAFYLESGYTSLNKKGEELCGDKVESVVNGDYTEGGKRCHRRLHDAGACRRHGQRRQSQHIGYAYLQNSLHYGRGGHSSRRMYRNHYSVASRVQGKRSCLRHVQRDSLKPQRRGVSGGVRQSPGDFRAGRKVRRPRKRRVERVGKKGLQVGA